MATRKKFINPAAFVDCTPLIGESDEQAQDRCVADIKRLDQDDAAWAAMVSAPFMQDGKPFEYRTLAQVARGVLQCKQLVAAKLIASCDQLPQLKDMFCERIRRGRATGLAYYVPPAYGDCSTGLDS